MHSLRIDPEEITRILDAKARELRVELGVQEVGHVLEVGDGIARIDGLPGVMAEEMLLFPHNVFGMAMNLERNEVGAIILGDWSRIREGDVVQRTTRLLEVPVGEPLLGRVVTPLGFPVDGRGPIVGTETRPLEVDAPGIAEREPVERPLQTGLKVVDALTAIGRGQRELIIGDRQTGKTTLAVDTILNQKRGDVYCVYVAIGQKMSTVALIVESFREHGVLRNCIVVVATAGDSSPLQYIAPFAGCAMAEYFRDRGQDALIVYDDLTKHAVAYRELSLLLRRPPGREAYPGDIFYLHSRLLERAAQLHPNRGGGSLTALPIVETQQGDYSAYIPTNLISITDGQIYLETGLFHQGFRPAMNVGLSVSRVGGRAQVPAIKKVALPLRLDLAQYREVASFSQLTSDLDEATLRQLHRGERLAEILKQPLHVPVPVEHEVCVLWAAVQGHLDPIPLMDVARFEREWIAFLRDAYPEIGRALRENPDLTPALEARLEEAMGRFRATFVPSGEAEVFSAGRVVPRLEDHEERLSETVVGVQR